MSFAAYTIFYIRFDSTSFYFICSYYKVPKLAKFFFFQLFTDLNYNCTIHIVCTLDIIFSNLSYYFIHVDFCSHRQLRTCISQSP